MEEMPVDDTMSWAMVFVEERRIAERRVVAVFELAS
jgi:hypothetical protein